MKIKSAKSFRYWYKTKIKEIDEYDQTINENFVGTYHKEKGKKTIKGFFEMYHGHKPEIASYLPSILKIAEDGQAIYEFLQNAVDCGSTHFYIFYNEKYFLAINNGSRFDEEGLESILNIAQTTKKDPDKIGRFGIGFKLAHRLVGKNEGTDELVNQYKGPVLFSWSKLQDLENLLLNDQVEPISPMTEGIENDSDDAPYLLKLLLTNFPTDVNESIKDINYKDSVLFPQEELNELVDFLNENFNLHSESLEKEVLTQGSLFFIKLGEDKKKLLDKDYSQLVNGIQYSMNTLKRLQKVYINSDDIEKTPLQLEEGIIKKGSIEFERISPEYKDFDIKFSIGFNTIKFGNSNSYEQIKLLKEKPNFYKYFPMGDEINGFGFIVHCDSFSSEANRRKLHEDDVNSNIFPELAKFITNRLEEYKTTDRDKFLNLYASLLLSEIPERQNNKWLRPIFYDTLLEYIQTNIPSTKEIINEAEKVKIKKFDLDISLSDLGLSHIHWFYWKEAEDFILLNEATLPSKIGIEEWSLRDVFINGDLNCLNNWIKNLPQKDYDNFLKELDKEYFSKDAIQRLLEAELFKFSNGEYYAINEVLNDNNLIFLSNKVTRIQAELLALDFSISELDITLFNFHKNIDTRLSSDEELYGEISERTKISDILTPKQKQNLFKNFISADTKFIGIGNETLKKLCLFADFNGNILPLNTLLSQIITTPKWLSKFKIHPNEYIPELDGFLIQEAEIYSKVVYPNFNNLIIDEDEVNDFYQKTIYYYSLEENNPPLKRDIHYSIYTKEGFKTFNEIFFNSKMKELENYYSNFQNAITSFLDYPTPQKSILPYLEQAPFFVADDNFCEHNINIVDLDTNDIKSVLSFCKLNNEQFFKNFIIKRSDIGFSIDKKTSETYQVQSADKEARKFIEENCASNLFVLPYEFVEQYRDEDGIVRADELYSLILDYVNIDEHKEILVDIVRYKAKYKFLNGLSEFRFNSARKYSKEDFEFKILSFACDLINEVDFQAFKDNAIIEADGQDLKLSDIPTNSENINIANYELSLAKVLPDSFHNIQYVSSLLDQFINLGLNKERIGDLFGIGEEPGLNDIFQMFCDQVETLENAEQLAFIFLYGLNVEDIDFHKFKALNINEEEVDLGFDKYLKAFDFIDQSEVLHQKYIGITKIITEFPIVVDAADNLLLLIEPYFEDEKFVCQYIKEDLSDNEKLSFIEFLYNKWDKKNKKTVIKNIDWSKIHKEDTQDILGFNPVVSVYPSKYACESEALPDYLINWIGKEKSKTDFLADFGIWTENSVSIELRKFLSNEIDDFQNNRLAQEIRFGEDETVLFNSFLWLQENQIELKNLEQFETFKKVVEVINDNRDNNDLIIEKKFDFEKIAEQSIEWDEPYYIKWKENNGDSTSIFIYDGELPKFVSLDEIEDYTFYYFNKGKTAIDQEKNIYVSNQADIKKQLRKLELDDSSFDFDALWQNKLDVLEKENAQLRRTNEAILSTGFDFEDDAEFTQFYNEGYVRVRAHWRSLPSYGGLSFNDYFLKAFENELQNDDGATLGTEFSSDISKAKQAEASREAKEIVKEKLEAEGFEFTKGIGSYSTIDGVINEGVEFPLVVKSYKSQNEPLKIGANEWIQLMRPNSMFWAYFGDGKLGCLKLYELLRGQDKLTISFSTENLDKEDRLRKFAELLHYFGNVHFDFNNVKPSDYSVAGDLSDYRFDDRINEEDLSSDDESLL